MSIKTKELHKLNNQLNEKIDANNQPIFTDIICYIRSSNISYYNQELVRHDLSKMILSAQARGEDIYSVIGGDFKDFCDEIIANIPPKTTKDKIYEGLDIFCSSMAILGTINILFSKDLRRVIGAMVSKQATSYSMGVSLGMILSTAIIMMAAIIIVSIISKNAFKKSKESSSLHKVVVGGTVGAGIMAMFIFIAKFGNHIVFSVNIFFAMLVLVGFYIAHKLLSRV